MSEFPLSFADGHEPSVPEVVPAIQEPTAVTPPPAPEPEPVPAPVLEPAPQAPQEPQDRHVPIHALLDERDKRKALEAELQAFRAREAQQQRPLAPDPYEDPAAAIDYTAQALRQEAMDIKLNLSEDFARSKHGDELVDKAFQWVQAQMASNPALYQTAISQRNPYDYLVQQYQRDQIASTVNMDEFAQFQAWKSAQASLSAQTVAPVVTQTPPPAPPRSQALIPNAGGLAHVPIGDDAVFASVFKGK